MRERASRILIDGAADATLDLLHLMLAIDEPVESTHVRNIEQIS